MTNTKTRSFTLRLGHGLAIGSDWQLLVERFRPPADLAKVSGPGGSFHAPPVQGRCLHPAHVVVSDFPHNGRKRVRLLVTVPAGMPLEPVER